jgi:SAM-dependent methyltransferase
MIIKALQAMVRGAHKHSCDRCADWSRRKVAAAHPDVLLDVGTGDGSFLLDHLGYEPKVFCGVEAAPELKKRAAARGLQMSSFDLNGVWPYASDTFDVVHSSQVIEHLHNTRFFAEEIHRVLKPGGRVFLTSENLSSFLNTGAMMLGYTPFTLMRCCGWFIGNPLGLHSGEDVPEGVPITDPAFAGVTGHIRALTVIQAQELFEKIGFVNVKVTSMGLMPLPEWLGMRLEKLMYRRGHLLLLEAEKPKGK